MLILSRYVGESIKVGDDVTVTVLAMKGGQVRIGVSAPKSVAVRREEGYERIRRDLEPARYFTRAEAPAAAVG